MTNEEKKIIQVDFDNSEYEIVIGRNVIDSVVSLVQARTNNTKVIIVADVFFKDSVAARVQSVFLQSGYSVYMYLMEAGKGNKNFNEVLKIYGIMEVNDLARDSTLVAIGGGVIGDLAGFVASTWLRGMNLVHIPTTLMAMVDSSVGGKVAINFRKTINAIGNYYHPILNLMDLDLIDSLSERDYCSGIAEVIKCALINDAEFYQYLQKNVAEINSRSPQHVVSFISRAIEIKIAHVKGDVKEGGKRLLLNYGHTLGHSIEISTEKNGKESYRHGEGVSIGIMAVSYIAQKHLGIDTAIHSSIKQIFSDYGLPTFVNCDEINFDRTKLLADCIANVKKDKKRLDNHLRLILVGSIGQASVYTDVPMALVEEAFRFIVRQK